MVKLPEYFDIRTQTGFADRIDVMCEREELGITSIFLVCSTERRVYLVEGKYKFSFRESNFLV